MKLLPTLAALTTLALLAAPSAAQAQLAPRLVVAISVDQFSGNLFDEWRGRYTEGLKRLSGGIAYTQGYQSHAATETCPGHSTLMTGKRPNKTGIVGNTMRDPETGQNVYCLFDPKVTLAHDPDAPPVGPGKLMVSTVGEWLKAVSPNSRVVSVSGKDRGAITMAGHNPDGVFWLYPGYGFTTYVRTGEDATQALAPVAEINKRQAGVWTARPEWTYTAAECKALESTWTIGKQEWRSTLPPTNFADADTPVKISAAVMASPIPDDLTLAAARDLIRSYQLGQREAMDLLTISFSANDFVGHRYGTRGPEMCEQQHRLDHNIGLLLGDLDALNIPYVVVLSADHGGSDFTERLSSEGYSDAARVNSGDIVKRLNDTLVKEFALNGAPLSGNVEELSFTANAPDAKQAYIAKRAIDLLNAEPAVAGAFTQDELLGTAIPKGLRPDEFTLKQRLAASTYRGRSADILAPLKPNTTSYSATAGGTIAGHGSPWNYDRRVPILFWWKDAPREDRFLPIETVDIAPTVAGLLGLRVPSDADGRSLGLAK